MHWKSFISVLLPLAILCGCQIDPPLHLRRLAETDVELKMEFDVDMMWQIDWQTEWVFDWDTEILGEVGYSMPEAIRLHTYPLGPDDERRSHQVNNFYGTHGRVHLFAGTHDMLFHNIGSEVNLFRSEDDLADQHAYTRVIASGLQDSHPVETLQQKAAGGSKVDEEEFTESVAFEPDELFSMYDPAYVISDNLDDYEFIDGRYILRIKGELRPATFIYLIQIALKNNYGRVIGCMGGAALTGVAEGVNLMNRVTHTETVSIPFDVFINRESDPDLLGARVLTFGIPGCNPYDEASVAATESLHNLILSITYSTGTYKNIRVDITDKLRELPTGGVITLELDVDDFPPGGDDPPVPEGGGFNAVIGEWAEEVGSTTIIN